MWAFFEKNGPVLAGEVLVGGERLEAPEYGVGIQDGEVVGGHLPDRHDEAAEEEEEERDDLCVVEWWSWSETGSRVENSQ